MSPFADHNFTDGPLISTPATFSTGSGVGIGGNHGSGGGHDAGGSGVGNGGNHGSGGSQGSNGYYGSGNSYNDYYWYDYYNGACFECDIWNDMNDFWFEKSGEDGQIPIAVWEESKYKNIPFTILDVGDCNNLLSWEEFWGESGFAEMYYVAATNVYYFDQNQNEILEEDEWQYLADGNPSMNFRDFDLNNDESVTADEYCEVWLGLVHFYQNIAECGSTAPVVECVSPPTQCFAYEKSGISLGWCRTFGTVSFTGVADCSDGAEARWEGGIVTFQEEDMQQIIDIFDTDGDKFIQQAELVGVGLDSTFPNIDSRDKGSEGKVTPIELFNYLLGGGDEDGLWFMTLFDTDCNGMIQPEEARAFCMYSPCARLFDTAEFYKKTGPPTPSYCPFLGEASALLPREALLPYLQAMRATKQLDPAKSIADRPRSAIDIGFFKDVDKNYTEGTWNITDDQRKQSPLVQAALQKKPYVIGPVGFFSLVQGEVGMTPEGWPEMLLTLYDSDGSGDLSREEAALVMWLTDDIFNLFLERAASSAPAARRAGEVLVPDDIDIQNGFAAWKRANVIFPGADTDGDGILSELEWVTAFGNDKDAPSFGKMDRNGDSEVDMADFLVGTYGTETLSYVKCALENPCQDCSTWDSGNGGCDTYAAGEKNANFCYLDSDKYGITAAEACPVACSGSQLICPPNSEERFLFDENGVLRDVYDVWPSTDPGFHVAAAGVLPAKALTSGTALGELQSMYEDPSSSREDAPRISLERIWAKDPVHAQELLQAPPLPPYRNGGINGAVINLDVRGSSTLAEPFSVMMGVDPCAIKRASGCTHINLDSIQLCAAGEVEMTAYDRDASYWRPVESSPHNVSNANCTCEDFTTGACHQVDGLLVEKKEIYRWLMVTTKPLCCIYKNTSKSCSSRTCLPDGKKSTQSHGFLGQGTATKMPKLKPSRRPTLTMKSQLDEELNRARVSYVPRTGWIKLCTDGLLHSQECPLYNVANPKKPGANWFLPRFGHAAAAVSSSRVLIYGGYGCQFPCNTVTAHSDVWELFTGFIGSKDDFLILRELSPEVVGQGGGVGMPIRGESHRMFVVGGSQRNLISQLLAGEFRQETNEPFGVRQLRVRDRQMEEQRASTTPSISGHSVVGNESQAIIFGGFVENTMTSGVFSYSMDRASADTAWGRIKVKGAAPRARGYGHMHIFSSDVVMLYGGLMSMVNDSGVGVKRVGNTELWSYSFVDRRWTEIDLTSEGGSVTPTAFDASAQRAMNNNAFIFVHGGVSVAYTPSLTSTVRISNKARNPFPFGPGPRNPTNELKALVPEEWVEGTRMSRWMRIRPRTQDFQCISAQPQCNSEGRSPDYWSCMPAPYPWWTAVTWTVGSCIWAPPGDSCVKEIDQATQGCVLQQPPAMQCEPPPRFMHSFTADQLLGGKEGAVVYGGRGMTANSLLEDVWVYPLYESFPTTKACENCGWLAKIQLYAKLSSLVCLRQGVQDFKKMLSSMFRTKSDEVHIEILESPTTSLNPTKQICEYTCPNEVWSLGPPAQTGAQTDNSRAEQEVKLTVQVSITNEKGFYDFLTVDCVENGGCKEAFFRWINKLYPRVDRCTSNTPCPLLGATLMQLQSMEGVDLEKCLASTADAKSFKTKCLNYREARVNAIHLQQDPECTENCLRGYCQFEDIGMYRRATQCGAAGSCGGTGWCSLPGPRSGHSATSFRFLNAQATLLIFGGQTTLPLARSNQTSSLLNDVVTGLYQGTALSMSRMRTRCTATSPCPRPRRDASVSIIDNRGSSSGKLIVFGGVAGGDADKFLADDLRGMVALDDTWVLDLDQINRDGQGSNCLLFGTCLSDLFWVELQVEGRRPMARFGAAFAALDIFQEGIIYLSDGMGIPSSNQFNLASTVELDDLFTFRLRDPFFRRCSATGSGLQKAVAGERTRFNVACTDILGAPAPNALFSVSINPGASCNNCPSVFPPVIAVGVGRYMCEYIPVVAGEYRIDVIVGRGGDAFKDPVGGDPNSPMSVAVEDIQEQLAISPGREGFNLIVSPAPTDRPESNAVGSALTLSTAGTTQTFSIFAVDAFQNRRPGGEDISVIMDRIGANDYPESGKVVDNNDGSYLVTYSLTVAGSYMVNIAISGVNGAGGPFRLRVEAQLSDTSLTYAYGQLLSGRTGVSHSLFVQTRDKYGNFISADPEEYPEGQDSVEFEACVSRGNTVCGIGQECPACLGGTKNNDLAIRVDYAVGPLGERKADGSRYLGLYKVTYLPLAAGKIIPFVRHNGVFIWCYFDSLDTPLDRLVDPVDEANACVEERILSELQDEARRGIAGAYSNVNVHSLSSGSDRTTSIPNLGRRSLGKAFDPAKEDILLNVNRTFTAPNVDTARKWLWLAPLLCAATGLGFVLLQMVVDWYLNRQHEKQMEHLREHHASFTSPEGQEQRDTKPIIRSEIAPQTTMEPNTTIEQPLPVFKPSSVNQDTQTDADIMIQHRRVTLEAHLTEGAGQSPTTGFGKDLGGADTRGVFSDEQPEIFRPAIDMEEVSGTIWDSAAPAAVGAQAGPRTFVWKA